MKETHVGSLRSAALEVGGEEIRTEDWGLSAEDQIKERLNAGRVS
jgi:hypothetical protein